ncbi:hypothetical protein, partial [Mycobacterium avium]|uniref:hypothetical protein n=1 Tax=Mycobacterium avium TaxID=1764 RepID=UPI0018AFD462
MAGPEVGCRAIDSSPLWTHRLLDDRGSLGAVGREIHCVTLVSVVTVRRFLSVLFHTLRGMGCSSREEIVKVFDALDAAVDRLGELSFDALTPRECLSLLQRC